jgi:excisionase family DNA binding protein
MSSSELKEMNSRGQTLAGSAEIVADGLLTVRECAEFLHLSRSKIYELMDAGELCFAKLGRSRRIPRRAVIELAARELRGGRRHSR